VNGRCEAVTGKREQAAATLERAEHAALAAGMLLHTAVARRSRGVLMGGDAGRELIAAGEAALRAEGIANPARLAAVVSPGIQ